MIRSLVLVSADGCRHVAAADPITATLMLRQARELVLKDQLGRLFTYSGTGYDPEVGAYLEFEQRTMMEVVL